MYRVEINGTGIAVFRFRNYDDAMNFVGLAVESGTYDGDPVAVSISEERGLDE